MNTLAVTFPCKCETSSPQAGGAAVCFGLAITPEGRPYALIVCDSGDVKVLYLDEHWSIKLELGYVV